MRALVVYESMYGNTRTIASAIASGLGSVVSVELASIGDVTKEHLRDLDLLIVGGPTHGHAMSRASTRQAAIAAAEKPDAGLVVEPGADGVGVREWIDTLGTLDLMAAAFDTRINLPALLTGRAATGIAKKLRRHGLHMVTEPESFLVTKHNELLPNEAARAEAWGRRLGAVLQSVAV